MIDFKRALNPSQLAAVNATEGPVLVIAGAGSGKTRVIEYRVLNMVLNKIDPESILLLTFTRRAAREMLGRAAGHDPRCAKVNGGTFHSFAFGSLKRYARAIGLSESFSILDESDAEVAIHKCCIKLGLYNEEKAFPRKDTLRSILSMSVNKNLPISALLKKEFPHFEEYADEIESVRKQYAEYRIQKNYLNYDDLLVYMKFLLEEKNVRDRLLCRYKYVMVDEYQDTNRLQSDIASLLTGEGANIMVVGDDAQSIYGFRGASHENIMDFPKRFPSCKIIKLEDNYRSTQAILDVANSSLGNMQNKYSKCLVAATKREGTRPVLLFFKDAYEEAQWIASEIKRLRDEGSSLTDQAVLFRSAYISIPLQAELSRRNIPYQIFGGLKFYETAHVKDCVSHLKIKINSKDELAWHRVLMLIDGIGPKTSEKISETIMAGSDLAEIADKSLGPHMKGHKYSQGLARLKKTLSAVDKKGLGVGELFEIVLDYYMPILQAKFDDWPIRINDLETLKQIAARYSSLEDFLADFSIEPPDRGVLRVEPSRRESEGPLTLSTIHSAKGLEWDTVFLTGLIDGIFPVSFALGSEDDIEEENRLFYVAVTRAKNNLFMSLYHESTRGGISQFNKMSRFVDAPNLKDKLEQKDLAFGADIDEIVDGCEESWAASPRYGRDRLLEEGHRLF